MNINLTAPVNQLSYGLCGLNILDQLSKQGHEVAWWPIGQTSAEPKYHEMLRAAQHRTLTYDVSAPSIRLYHEFDLAQHVGKGKHIGWPIFEVSKFNPNRLAHLKNQDELIVCSKWAAQVCFENGIPIYGYDYDHDHITNNINVIPLGVDPEIFYEKDCKAEGPTHFIHIGKREYRKGQYEMLRCFEKAFSPKDEVFLTVVWGSPILQQMNPQDHDKWTQLFMQSPMVSKIRLVEFVPSQTEVANLLRSADCGLFFSRAEGFNLGLLECMAVGNRVIATDISAHTEFLTNANALKINMLEREAIFDGVWFKQINGEDGEWGAFGKNEEEQAISHMRAVHIAKQSGSDVFNSEGVKTGARLTWGNTVKELVKVL